MRLRSRQRADFDFHFRGVGRLPGVHTMSRMDSNTTDDGHPRVAQELLDRVLDHLHRDSESLKQCALASRSLLPTCQRHLFSTYKISESNASELVELFTPPASTDEDDENATLRPRVADLFNTYTNHLILTDHPVPALRSVLRVKYKLPEFKNVEKITFKGDELSWAIDIPSFLMQTWTSPSSKIRSVELDFRFMTQRSVLESLCTLPGAVEDVSFISPRPKSTNPKPTATSIRRNMEVLREVPNVLNGTLKLRLPSETSERLLPIMFELGDFFEFNLKRIDYRLTLYANVPDLASLVDKCKNTLEYLYILVSFPSAYRMQSQTSHPRSPNTAADKIPYLVLRRWSWGTEGPGSLDFSHHRALRSIRIWTPAAFDPDWLSEAISSIPKPSNATPRVPPLRIGLHISLPQWMMYPEDSGLHTSKDIDGLVASWVPVDTQLSRLVGFSPDSAASVTDGTTAGILLDITIPELTTGPGKGVAALLFPRLSDIKGLVRLV